MIPWPWGPRSMGATWVTKAIGLLSFSASSGSYYWPFWAPFLGLMAINCYCSCSCGMRLKLENSRQWGPLSMKDNWVPETIGFVGPIAPSGFRYKKQRYSRPFWGPKVLESREFITDVAFIGYDSLSSKWPWAQPRLSNFVVGFPRFLTWNIS